MSAHCTLCPTSPSLPWVAWVSLPHLLRYYAPLRLPPCPSRGLRLSLASPIPCLLPGFVVSVIGSWRGGSPHRHARAFGHPVPHSGYRTRRQVALPRSRVPPVKTCPALRPRWCPAHSPKRTQDCCLPVTGNRRRSPRYALEGEPLDHDSTHVGAPSRGLRPRSTRLRTAPDGEARGCAPDRLARRSSGGIRA